MTAGSRKSRNYKERGAMVTFGQIVLPVAALVAVGLLFVGVKLFFLTPPAQEGVEVTAGAADTGGETEAASGDPAATTQVQSVASGTEAKPEERKPQQPKQKVALAGPVDPAKATKPTRTAAKPAVAAKSAKPAQIVTAQGSQRWGVQIGAFSKEEGAKTIAEQAKKDGYATTISTVNASSGTMFYRVRINAGDTREKAERLAAELEKKNYPVQVLPLQ